MSVVEYSVPQEGNADGAPTGIPAGGSSLHRLAEVRRRQGVSRRAVARRLNMDVQQVKLQERHDSDISLSELYRWQEALDVPIAELLVDANDPLSPPVLRRAQFVRLMKTAAAILQRSQQIGIRRMAQVLVDQLTEIMPELADVHPWHAVGQRRSENELGKAAERGLWSDLLNDMAD